MARQTRGTRKNLAAGEVDAKASKKPAKPGPKRRPAAKKTAPEPRVTADPAPAQEALDRIAGAGHAPTAQKLAQNIERIEQLGHRLLAAFAERAMPNPNVEAPGPDLYRTAAEGFLKTLTEQPSRMIEMQVSYWGETLANYARAQQALSQGQWTAPEDDAPADKRFANPLWQNHPYFNLVKRQYQTNARALKDAAAGLELPDEVARKRIGWLTNQIVDMMAPTNFLATNPDALERAIETEGESLVRGLENLVRDIEQHGGEMIVSLADRKAFAVGENIGTTPGQVVHRSRLFELIQYAPMTEQVHETPLIVFPPWINKFYILDLKPKNSMIQWLLEQGHSLFVVSWKNPDASFSEVGIEDYVEAYLEAMDRVRDLTGQPKLNAVGYCIAGTTLSLTLALLAQRGDDRVNAATLFTTLTDFSEQGEFVNFLQDDFVDGIEQEVNAYGLMRAGLMSRTMSFLRANDLVWGPAIRSYMMGETPPAFDLLFWNGDSTNLPGRMAIQYLRGLCQRNEFATDGFRLMGHDLRLSDVALPICAIACEADHIAPWKDCWRGFARMGSQDKTFILSESGHVAGIVNPPSRVKYGHYAGQGGFDQGHDAWRESTGFHEGSWWPRWGEWLAERAGPMVDARHPEDGIEPAPGSYVHERAG
ncbi:class I poly(R)-hydroxyalkanoic acid synthase [Paracoccus zeaxanthinifaciens]|uniref:class I poly(R)-hydroxyalkanoic acid synthase n=1 Tax=Paracoccus zeaxanthinifaciens TaxID=187400 RepID=UPI0003B5B494|nr:class I poly(R)-hydroxyalkanoic acid synthase [Paracoccus zeaxanthinifaciens]